ncbi:hypothetical protein M413DRAFT_21853 [Hebeloma cylindrosporum]|uniref:Uncharacterized protein n=1 Tax=Hebeloma cylindrosporum TaxID=76867 RepID=A0A0C2Z976_HEBCY|nr:hypothetical protein M413DRAFT_21853 [Hebeloma cylindrosporum h7]
MGEIENKQGHISPLYINRLPRFSPLYFVPPSSPTSPSQLGLAFHSRLHLLRHKHDATTSSWRRPLKFPPSQRPPYRHRWKGIIGRVDRYQSSSAALITSRAPTSPTHETHDARSTTFNTTALSIAVAAPPSLTTIKTKSTSVEKAVVLVGVKRCMVQAYLPEFAATSSLIIASTRLRMWARTILIFDFAASS